MCAEITLLVNWRDYRAGQTIRVSLCTALELVAAGDADWR
jgi:hypothetical protein